ncbi:hypothetical protein PTKIN_Ptkin12aG0089900 [Pterospermum kingtungense]
MDTREEERGDPLLRGGSRKCGYTHGFSSDQIQSLSGICETFVPPLPLDTTINTKYNVADKAALHAFYKASGAEPPVPDEVAELMVKRDQPKGISFVKVVLTLLSFRLGTLFLCGWLCCDSKWPFILKFSETPVERREKILMKWSGNAHPLPLRAVFALIKTYCLFVFISMIIDLLASGFPLFLSLCSFRLYIISLGPFKKKKSCSCLATLVCLIVRRQTNT